MMDFDMLETLVCLWASKHGIFSQGTTIAQAEKTLEEAQEIKDAIEEGDRDKLVDALGDTLVTLIVQAEMNGVDLIECGETAWNEIKDRQGKMVDGQFVKEVGNG
jgi:NTP pyrophosphatase (non-canonical NTP hydrolase)